MPTIFVTYLMLDSYGQPHFLIDTVPCPLPLLHIWFLPYYEYGSILCSLIRTFLSTYMYINPCIKTSNLKFDLAVLQSVQHSYSIVQFEFTSSTLDLNQ